MTNGVIVLKKTGPDNNKYMYLPANHKTVLQVISVLYSPASTDDIYNLLKKINLGKNNGAYFTQIEIQQILSSLIKDKIIQIDINTAKNKVVNFDFMHDATKEALKRNAIKNHVHVMQSYFPEFENNKMHPDRTLRDFRISLYQNLSFRAIDAKNAINNSIMIAPLLKKISPSIPLDFNWTKTLSPGYQPFIIELLLERSLSNLHDAHKLIDYARSAQEHITPKTQLLIAEYEFSQADTYSLQDFLKRHSSNPNNLKLISAITDFISNKNNDPANFEKIFNKFAQENSNNLFYILGIFMLINNQQNITDDDLAIKNYNNLLKKLKKISKTENRFSNTIIQAIYLIQHLLTQRGIYPNKTLKSMALDLNNSKENAKKLNADEIISHAISLAITPSISEEYISYFHKQFDGIEQQGYLFYNGLIDQCLRTHQARAHIPSYKRPLQAKLGWAYPIIPNMIGTKVNDFITPTPVIPERLLKAGVQKILQRRIIWYFSEQTTELNAIEQKLSEKGWSKGRNIAPNEIINYKAHFSYLDEKDIAICSAFSRLKHNESGLINHTNKYIWNKEDLFEALINHPRIYHNRYRTVKLNFHEGSPEIYLDLDNNINNNINNNNKSDSISLIKTDEQNFDVIFPQNKIQTAYQELLASQNNSQLPEIETLNKLIQNNAICFSDTEIKDIKTQKADETLHLLLTPNNKNAVDISIKIRPQGDTNKNSYITPGKKSNFIIDAKTQLANQEVKPDLIQLIQYKRDLKNEVNLANMLIQACPILEAKLNINNYSAQLDSPEECLDLLSEISQIKTPNIKISWPQGEIKKVKGSATLGNFTIKLTQKGHWFQATGDVQIDENTKLSLEEVLNKISKNKSDYIELAPGEFIKLNKHFKDKLEQIALIADKSDNDYIINSQHAHAFESILEDVKNIETDESWQKQLQKFSKPAPKLNLDNLNVQLRPYQEEGVQWLNMLSNWGLGACLADDMGLGKTIQAIVILDYRAKKGPQLVIAPTSVCYNWHKEITKIAPKLNPYILNDHPREELLKKAGPNDIIIASYGLLQHAGMLLKKTNWTTTILDEAQSIKNSKTKRAKMAFELQSECRIALSGTPIENHLQELWSLFNFLNPGFLGNYNQFSKKYIKPIESDKDSKSISILKKIIQPYILRRHKSEVLKDLPKKTEQIIDIQLSDEEMAFYENLRENALLSINKEDKPDEAKQHAGHRRMHILSEITKLRQACCHPRIIEPQIQIPSSKLEKLEQMLEELLENGHKVLIFSQFVSYLQHVQMSLSEKNIDYHYLDGSTPQKQREKSVEAFQRGEKSVFLLSLKAGGVGLNLTEADYVIILDPWWNPAVENQAADRAHRIGQLRPVTLYRLICKNTIEEKIIALHQKKKDLSDSLLTGTHKGGALNEKELLNLIQGSTNN